MYPQLEALFDEAENRYLNAEELNVISQYVLSLPDRLTAYRLLRDQELTLMQRVADHIQVEMPQETRENLERSIKNALLLLRSCGMAMLINDKSYIQERLLNWVRQTVQVYNTTAIDTAICRLLNQQLSQVVNQKQMNYLKPMLLFAQSELLQAAAPLERLAASNGR